MSYQHLSQKERYQILVLLQAKMTKKAIADILNRHPSTISRELKRNSLNHQDYKAHEAIPLAKHRRKNSCNAKRVKESTWNKVLKKLTEYHSPEQIAAKLKGEVSTEGIYQYLYRDKARFSEYKRYLRHKGKKYRHKRAPYIESDRQYKRPIKSRPKYIELRKTKGHWEGDTVVSRKDGQALVTLVERKSGLTLIGRVTRPTASNTSAKIIELLSPLKSIVKSITFDNGREFSNHRQLEYYLNTKVYFAEPYKSWQRGTNENTNGLIRQFIPKTSKLSSFCDEQIKKIQYLLNTRPRKRHNYKAPIAFFTSAQKKIALHT